MAACCVVPSPVPYAVTILFPRTQFLLPAQLSKKPEQYAQAARRGIFPLDFPAACPYNVKIQYVTQGIRLTHIPA